MDLKPIIIAATEYVSARLNERSTYMGIISCAAAVGITLSPQMASEICQVAAAVAGIVLVITSDNKTPPAPPAA